MLLISTSRQIGHFAALLKPLLVRHVIMMGSVQKSRKRLLVPLR
jgi:hypothetical protein